VIPRPSEVEDGCTGFWWENLKQTTLEDLGVNERIMLKLTFKNRVDRCRQDSSGSQRGPVVASCEGGNEPSAAVGTESNGKSLSLLLQSFVIYNKIVPVHAVTA